MSIMVSIRELVLLGFHGAMLSLMVMEEKSILINFHLLFQAIFLIPGKIYTVSGIMEQWTAFIRRMAVTPWGIMEAQPSPTTTPWPTLSPCVATISVLRLVQATPTVLFSGRVHVVESRGT